MKYMLDTNVCIATIKECPEEVKEKPDYNGFRGIVITM